MKIEDPTAYLNEMMQVELNLPNEIVQIVQPNVPDPMAENFAPNLPGQEIKIEDVEIIIEDVEMQWVDYGDVNDMSPRMAPNDIDMSLNVFPDSADEDINQRRWAKPPQDKPILSSSRCEECGISLNQYIRTRKFNIMEKLHKKCMKKCISCRHCGLNLSHSVHTRQQTLYREQHTSCPTNY